VRQRTTLTFQLDLSGRDLFGVTRVVLVGSDPLRGLLIRNCFSGFPGTHP